jgi:tetratricopeptide (TPR) repeat protein
LAAALFAAHPLRVESVVWVVERKDVLSAFFYLASLWFYAAYARRPNTRSYLAVVAAFVLGIMSKQMVVSLPFVLLALDFWPLGRFAGKGALRKLLIEKIPLFVLALAGALAAHLAMNVFPKMAGAAYLPKTHPLGVAAASVIHSYAFYLWKTVVPTDLAAFYPHPGASLAVWVVPASIVGLVLITLAAWKAARARPYLAMGWAWYAVTLLPTAGIVYSGQLAAADRFTYIPSIGLCIALAWLIPEARSTVAKTVSTALACAAIVALGAASWVQVGYWSDSIALFERALRVTTNNSTAHYNLGAALIDQREFDQGIFHYERALEIDPRDSRVLNRMGIMLSMAGRHDEAIDHINRALEVVPTSEGTQSNLGVALMNAGRTDEAAKIFTNILKRNPNNALARENLETVRQHQLNQQ